MQVENYGRLRRIQFPQDWVETKRSSEPLSAQDVRSFHAPANDSTQVRLAFGGRAQAASVGHVFVDMLAGPGRELNAGELKSVLPMLGVMADTRWFAIESARTTEVAGRRVLAVGGRYLQDPYAMKTLFVDTDESGTYVQEISFVCPTQDVETAQGLFDHVLASLEWLD